MKGVSTVIATILMLMITIGLAGVAAGYIFGWFTSETAVVLSIEDTLCESNGVTVWIKNGGTETSGAVTVDAGGTSCAAGAIASIGPGLTASCKTTAGPGAGTHRVTVTSGAARETTTVYCAA